MITSIEQLRQLYPEPKGRAVRKQLAHLDEHCRRFIALSPFAVIATSGDSGHMDASPRGGEPGFMKVADERTLLLPDSPGNNRLDSLTNIIENGGIGLLVLVPGVDETLRINGSACLREEAEVTAQFAGERRTPRLVIEITVEEAYLHCAKALMRSRLWSPEARNERSVLPTMSRMIMDQVGEDGPEESQAAMAARYRDDL
ncbi:pyridoxamine 5'-phosphate oxidase family protein [Ectothiorhodospiraceae bacterium WFHF3C12]|nr:pyridoxamine 5'-phosphate oxidase family protein [Ectothiorhodospiraceae bacterium WFHF3C12]